MCMNASQNVHWIHTRPTVEKEINKGGWDYIILISRNRSSSSGGKLIFRFVKSLFKFFNIFWSYNRSFFGPPLCQSPYPTLSTSHYLHSPFQLGAHVAHITLGGPPQLDDLEDVANALAPPKRATWFCMFNQCSCVDGVRASSPRHVAMI